jgi:hypothetical protein
MIPVLDAKAAQALAIAQMEEARQLADDDCAEHISMYTR